jgi:hypothetical protein
MMAKQPSLQQTVAEQVCRLGRFAPDGRAKVPESGAFFLTHRFPPPH